MTAEARGGVKRPEDLRWLVNFARSQGERLGRAYLDFGTPLAVRERLAELHADDPGGAHAVERIALQTCHRINRATPVTVTAVVCLALLAADRSLTAGRGAGHRRAAGPLYRGTRLAGGGGCQPDRSGDDPADLCRSWFPRVCCRATARAPKPFGA